MLYTVLGVQEAQTDTVLYTVWGSERVKASASRAEGPGFKSSLRWDFFGVESYQ